MIKSIRRSVWETLKPTVEGFGINDVNYNIREYKYPIAADGKRQQKFIVECPYYRKWRDMLKRCYNKTYLKRFPTYQGCTVCEEWRYLSNFIEWVDKQPNKDWERCHLDKDFLIQDNKLYSPETVVFIHGKINTFIINRRRDRGNYMLGVCCISKANKVNPYQAQCMDPFGKNQRHVGYYPTELEAHKAWQERKHQYACQLADIQDDPRVAKTLRELYAPDKDFTNK